MEEQIKNKLYDFELTPPVGAWNTIAGELKDSNLLMPLAGKMHHHEVPPPAAAWMHILKELQMSDVVADIIAVKPGKSLTYKLLIAAVFTGVVMAGGIYFMSNSSMKKQLAGKLIGTDLKKEITPAEEKPDVADILPPEPQPAQALQAGTNIAPGFSSPRKKNTFVKKNNKIIRNAIVRVRSLLHLDTDQGVKVPARPIRDESGDIIQDLAVLSTHSKNYIMVTGPNGEQTRISSKFINVLLYINGDTDIDFNEFRGYFDNSFLESIIWKTRFKNWRKHISKNSLSPSSTNFMDILEFKDLITKENQ